MNRRIVLNRIGQIMCLEAVLMLLPLLVSLLYKEYFCTAAFGISIAAAAAFGAVLVIVFKTKDDVMFAKEGFTIVSIAWILLSVVGALPFFISGEIPNFADAFFETASGLTTTGASILENVEVMSKSILFWRSFTHWIGGMGILVLVMAIMPNESGRSIHIMRAEMAGPVVGKLVPKIKETAKILYIIYLALTVVEIIFLLAGGMPFFDSVVHALGTAGTGGYGIRSDSIGGYSPYLQWVIAIFMVIFGINFNLYYLLLMRKFGVVLKNLELWIFLGIIMISTVAISIDILPIYGNAGDSVRNSFFQVTSIMSTTGYSTADFNLWPSLSRSILFILMFFGGCAGSTAGGLKISRIIILVKSAWNDIKQQLHPRSVTSVKIDGKALDNNTIRRVNIYFFVYMALILIVFLLISFDSFGLETNLTASISCVNNVGPGLGAVGPSGNYSGYSDFSTIVLALSMILGRLEIFPFLLALNPHNWVNKNK